MAIGANPRRIEELQIGKGFANGGIDLEDDGTITSAGDFTRKGDSGGQGGAATPMFFAVEDTETGGGWDAVNPWGAYDFVSADGLIGVVGRMAIRMDAGSGVDTALEWWVEKTSALVLGMTLDSDKMLTIQGNFVAGGLAKAGSAHVFESASIGDEALTIHLADGQLGSEWQALVISGNDNTANINGIFFEVDSIPAANAPGMAMLRTSATAGDLMLFATFADARVLHMTLDGSANTTNFALPIDAQGGILKNSLAGLAFDIASGDFVFTGGDMHLKGGPSDVVIRTINTDAAIADGEVLGAWAAGGEDTDETDLQSATISAKSAEAWGVGATGSRLEFRTTPIGSGATALALTIDEDKGVFGPLWKNTVEGGRAVLLTNKTGAPSVVGEVVKLDPANDDSVILTVSGGTGDDDSIGVFYEGGIADGSAVWIVYAGRTLVRADAGGFARADRVIASSVTGGRARVSNSPASAAHFAEIGHALEAAAANATGFCMIHLN